MNSEISALCGFLDESKSVYHAQRAVVRRLENAGYARLNEWEGWSLTPGGKYYVTRGGSAAAAFRIPEGSPTGFLFSASHCDRPCLQYKGILEGGNYTRIAVEGYGGAILSTWLDRPLSLAGRVSVATEDGIQNKLIDIDRDLLVIPNVAIHMNREVNSGYKWNPAVDLLPLAGGPEAAQKLRSALEEAAGGKILGHDLYLYLRQEATVWGVGEEYISAQALDDLECVWGCTQGFLESKPSRAIPVLCVFDSEEVGSGSVQGAASTFLREVVERICGSLGYSQSRLLAQSFMVSADNAQAVHPNHPEYADPSNAPVPGGGVVLKFNANLRYCTDGAAAALLRTFAEKAGIRVQDYRNRADIPGGSTLGRISLAQVSVPTADIGLAQLAMHSAFETASAKDAGDLLALMRAYYSSALERTEDGCRVI